MSLYHGHMMLRHITARMGLSSLSTLKCQFSWDHFHGRLSKFCLITAASPFYFTDFLVLPCTGCCFCVNAELAIEQCRLDRVHRTCGLTNTYHRTYRRYQTGLEIPVDFSPYDPLWVSRMKEKLQIFTPLISLQL